MEASDWLRVESSLSSSIAIYRWRLRMSASEQASLSILITTAVTPGEKERDTEGHRDTQHGMGNDTGKYAGQPARTKITLINCYYNNNCNYYFCNY